MRKIDNCLDSNDIDASGKHLTGSMYIANDDYKLQTAFQILSAWKRVVTDQCVFFSTYDLPRTSIFITRAT